MYNIRSSELLIVGDHNTGKTRFVNALAHNSDDSDVTVNIQISNGVKKYTIMSNQSNDIQVTIINPKALVKLKSHKSSLLQFMQDVKYVLIFCSTFNDMNNITKWYRLCEKYISRIAICKIVYVSDVMPDSDTFCFGKTGVTNENYVNYILYTTHGCIMIDVITITTSTFAIQSDVIIKMLFDCLPFDTMNSNKNYIVPMRYNKTLVYVSWESFLSLESKTNDKYQDMRLTVKNILIKEITDNYCVIDGMSCRLMFNQNNQC